MKIATLASMRRASDAQGEIRRIWVRVAMLGVLLGCVWGGVAHHGYWLEKKAVVDALEMEMKHHLEASEAHIMGELSQLTALLRALSMSHIPTRLLAARPAATEGLDLPTVLAPIQSHILEFRLLDTTGMERARLVGRDGGGMAFLPAERMASRADSACFLAARDMPPGRILVDPVSTLGPDTGALPLPLLRLTMPVVGADDAGKSGLMVLLIDGRELYWRHVESELPVHVSLRRIEDGFVYRRTGGRVEVMRDAAQGDAAPGLFLSREIRLAERLPLVESQRHLVWRLGEYLPGSGIDRLLQDKRRKAWAMWVVGMVWLLLLMVGMAASRRGAVLADAERAELLEEVHGLSRQLIRAHEDERRALARVLHDEVGQSLAAVQLRLGGLARDCEGAECNAADRVRGEERYIGEAMDALRGQLRLLRPPQLDVLGLRGALLDMLDEMRRLHGLEIDAHIDDSMDGLDGVQSMGIYRLAREALTNIRRHAGASKVMLQLKMRSAHVHLSVEDDGRGFDMRQKAKGFGIIGMREQVALLEGEMRLESRPGGGTRLHVEMPARPGDVSPAHAR